MVSCSPFVMFDAPNDIAFRIHSLLGSGHGNDGSLSLCWWLRALFQDDGSMRYVIEPFDYRLQCGSWCQWGVWFA